MKHAITIVVVLALTAGVVSAQRSGPGCSPRMDNFNSHRCMKEGPRGLQEGRDGIGHILRFADEINLSDKQRQTLEDLRYDFKLEQIDRRAEVGKAGVALKALMRDDDADERDVFEAIDKAAALKAELQKMRYSHRKQMRAVLTAEQRAQLKELRGDGRGREMEEHKVIRRRIKKG